MDTATDNVLRWMRHWIWMERDKYRKGRKERAPGVEPFVLTSLAFAAAKVFPIDDTIGALARLHKVAKQRKAPTYDVLTPNDAIGHIQLALRCTHCNKEHRPTHLDHPRRFEGRALCKSAYAEATGRRRAHSR